MTEKLSNLHATTTLDDDDLLYCVDVSQTSGSFSGTGGRSLKITKANLLKIGTIVQAHSAILDAVTAAYTTEEKTKLSGIETAATADQTGAEIKTLYEAEANTNAYTDAEKTKLSGIEVGATANSTDASLRARENHTGTQLASTISDFDTAVDARIEASDKISSDTTDVTGAIPVVNIIAISQADYDALSEPRPTNTAYYILQGV